MSTRSGRSATKRKREESSEEYEQGTKKIRTLPPDARIVDSKMNEGKSSRILDFFTFGANDSMQLGDADVDGQSTDLVYLPKISDLNTLSFVCGKDSSFVLEVNHIPKYRNVYSWGGEVDNLGREVDENEHGPVGIEALNEQPLLQIAVGTHHALALTSTGEVISWGIYKDKDGPIGFKPHLSADELQDHPDVMTELEEYKIIQIASSCSRSLALTETGDVFEWGDTKMKKKTLVRHKKEMLLPSHVLIPSKIVAIYAEANGDTCFAENQKGKILAWGRNQYYQCGIDPEVKPSEKVSDKAVAKKNAEEKRKKLATHTRPTSAKQINNVLEAAADKVEKISSGRLHTVMLTEKGDVYTWGNNKMGQLGQNLDLDATVAVPTKLKFKGLKGKIIDVASGPFHTLLLTDKGEVYGFGGNKNGCLGELDEFQNKPAKIDFKENPHMRGKIVGIACGSRHNLIASSRD